MDFEKNLFKLFAKNMDEYELYNAIVELNKKTTRVILGRKMSDMYCKVVKVENSVNNAGCEERRGQQIDSLRKITSDICDEYEEFLP